MRTLFIITAAVCAIVAILFSIKGGNVVKGLQGKSVEEIYGIKPQEIKSSEIAGEAQIGGDFVLTDVNNKKVSASEFRGKQMLVYFGFTNCPMICPTDVKFLSNVLEKLGDKKNKIATIFITVDPERDTPAQIKTFLSNFDPSIIGLTGTSEEIKNVQSAFKVYSAKTEEQSTNGYNVDHSAFIYLMDEQGKYKAHFTSQTRVEEIIEKLGL